MKKWIPSAVLVAILLAIDVWVLAQIPTLDKTPFTGAVILAAGLINGALGGAAYIISPANAHTDAISERTD